MDLKLAKNEAIQILGPSKIEVIKGEIEVFGKKVKKSKTIILKKGKSIPIEANQPSELEISTESPENIRKIMGPTISNEKKELANEILKFSKPCRVILIGSSDTGKTSLINYLGNRSIEKGFTTAILDLDVGQQSIGIPTTIAYGILKDSILYSDEIPLNDLYFVGNTTPSGYELRCLAGINNLLRNLSKIDVVLIDTSGWTRGNNARSYKLAKIELIKPDIIVGLQAENEIEYLLKPFAKNYKIRRIGISKNIHPRSFNDRRFLREVAFRKYFSNAQIITLNCDEIALAYTLFKSGEIPNETKIKTIEEIMDLKIKYCEISKDGIFLVQAEEKYWKLDNLNLLKETLGIQNIHIVQVNEEKGILVGLVGINKHLGIGIIEEIDYENDVIKIFTPVIKDKIRQIQFGGLQISKSGVELNKIRPFF